MKINNYRVHTALILSAASGIIYEVVATNMLFFYFVRNTHSISTVLAVFMFGLGLGSFLVHYFNGKIKQKETWFGFIQFFIGLFAFFVLSNLTNIIPALDTFGIFVVSFFILLIPTTMLGAIFPLAGSIMGGDDRNITGLVYSFDLSGAVAGSLIAGFLLVPFYGNKFTIMFAVALNLTAAIIMFHGLKRKINVVFLITITIIMVNSLYFLERKSNQIFRKNSPYGLVEIKKDTLYIDGRDQCSNSYDETTAEKMIVNYSLSNFDSRKLKVLNIGLGCGLTLKKIIEKVDFKVDVVEINPVVVEANAHLSNILKNEKVNLIIKDGFEYLRNINDKYDSIIIDIENPAVLHSSNLYTVEFFKLINTALKERGTLGLWVCGCPKPIYYDTIFNTLKKAFPHVYKMDKFTFIASKQELGYPGYHPAASYSTVNTLDKKTLSKIYFDECGNWFDKTSDYILTEH